LDFSSAFVFGKNSKGKDWIEISGRNIPAIYFLPGNYKSEEAYYNNNRIKKVLAELITDKGAVVDSTEYEFPDNPYKKLNYSNFYESLACVDCINEYSDFEENPTKVRITVLEVYKGKKWNDTCISEIFVSDDNLNIN